MLCSASILSDFWDHQLVSHHRQGLFLVLVGFLGSFAFIRFSARLGRSPRAAWWPGSVVSGGVHLHHLVWGICLMLAGGTLGFASIDTSPWREVCAGLFGIGAGLTVDEFALWVYLDDVYWAEEGRSSIDAAVIAGSVMLLVLFGARPFGVGTGSVSQVIAASITAAIVLCLASACLAKQRTLHAVIGLFLWPIALYGALRLGKPGSPWARRFYAGRRPRKQAKAQRRFSPDRRTERWKDRFRDKVGGTTNEVFESRLRERAAGRQAAAEVLHRAERVGADTGDGPETER